MTLDELEKEGYIKRLPADKKKIKGREISSRD